MRFFSPEQVAAIVALNDEDKTWNTASTDEKAYAWGACEGCTTFNHNGDHNDEDTVMLADTNGDEFTCCPKCFEDASW